MTINRPSNWSLNFFFQNKVSLCIERGVKVRQMEIRNFPEGKSRNQSKVVVRELTSIVSLVYMMFQTHSAIDPQNISPLKPNHSCDCDSSE